jgi:hypothetical protein
VTYGGDSGNRIFVLYWRCPLIRVSVIRGSTVFIFTILKSPFTSFSHLLHGLPPSIVDIGLHSYGLLTVLTFSIRYTRPNQLSIWA